MADLKSVLDRFGRANILVVGDLILDQYIWGQVKRISPEAPIPVVEVVRESYSLGGASNVANNIDSLGISVKICGIVGDDGNGRKVVDMLNQKGIDAQGVVTDPERPTTLKTRVVAHKQQVVRVDREDTSDVNEAVLREMRERILGLLPQVEAIILEDYGKGVINKWLLQEIVPLMKKAGKIITVDPKKDHFDYYQGVTGITPNRQEAEEVAEIRISDSQSMHEVGMRLIDRLQCDSVLLTLGAQGMCLVEKGGVPLEIPARAREVFDVSGAGDTVIAVFTSALVAGASTRQAAVLSNVAGSLVVEKLGTATVSCDEIRKRLGEMEGQ